MNVSDLFRAIRGAPRGRQLAVARALSPFLFTPARKPANAEPCEFDSLENYPSRYARLASLLGRPEQVPTPGEIDLLHRIQKRGIHYSGAIGSQDYFFLTAVASILAPPRALEIGTSSGFSSALIAAALHRRHLELVGTLVDTIDLHPQYLHDPTKPVGFEIPDLLPQLADAVSVHRRRDSNFVRELARPDELAFVFIDADHQHPWPLLDSLRVAPYVRGGGWLVLHDIQLGTMGVNEARKGKPFPYGAPFGAEWLFDGWLFRKISGGNIGALQLPTDKLALAPMALNLMQLGIRDEPSRYEEGLISQRGGSD